MKKILLAFLPLVLLTTTLSANVDTTARIKGTVNVAGATVEAVHTPTNTTKSVVSSASGNFNINFLPIGGPYIIKISRAGYETQTINVENLTVANPIKLSVNLISDNIDEVQVIASKVSSSKVNSGSVLSSERIAQIPTITRNIADYLKFDPRVSINGANARNSEISVLGKNSRLNDFTIDGVSFNDAFGLNDNGFATMKNPISIDFVDEITVDITPYDVSKGNATGGTITAVSKSGTNEFHGSVYTTSRDKGNVGDLPNGEEYSDFQEDALAITLSGPIIKDKLFFFLGYEESEDVRPSLWGTSDSNATNKWDTSSATMDAIAKHMLDTYGYTAGSYNSITFPTTQEQLLVKLNGNINDDHRAELVYQVTEDSYYANYDSSGRPTFSNNYYEIPPETERVTVNIYSDWTDRFSTRIRFSDRFFEQDANSGDGGYGGLMPEFHIYEGGDIIYVGSDRYRGHNLIEVDQQLMSIKGNLDFDNHYITFGYETDSSSIYNSFINRYTGELNFSGLANFYAGNYNRVETFAVSIDAGGPYSLVRDDPALPAARFDIDETIMYLQDEWQVNDNLSVAFGVRHYDFDIPQQALLNTSYQSKFGFRNNATVSYKVTQPRFSFDMDVSDSMFGDSNKVVAASLTGGYGLFHGRLPKVFFSNGFGRSSVDSFYSRFGRGGPDSACAGPIPNLNSAAVTGVTDPRFFWYRSSASTCALKGASSNWYGFTHGTDPNFEGPQTWRGNLKLDMLTASGYDISIEYNRDKVKKDVDFRDYSYEVESVLADGRPVTDSNENTYITNTSQGGGYSITTAVQKGFDNGLELYFGYTNMHQEDVAAMTSAQHSSSYGYQPRGYGELVPAARSSFMNEHKFVLALSYTTQIIGDNDTTFSLLGIRKSGEPHSITFDGDSFNGRGRDGYDLAYIPTGADDPNVVFSSGQVAQDVMNFVNSKGCISKYAGQIIPRNTCDNPWQGRIDLRITQEIALGDKGHKLVGYLDVQNLYNLLSNSHGWAQEVNYNVSRAIIVDGADDSGRYEISGVDTDDSYFFSTANGQSMWQINFGLAYRF
tara:strand:- start:4379 stop:7546 length:3168 start_codon:yes stop_codon:yes gene_type:complete